VCVDVELALVDDGVVDPEVPPLPPDPLVVTVFPQPTAASDVRARVAAAKQTKRAEDGFSPRRCMADL
jgi:hypothetical protein